MNLSQMSQFHVMNHRFLRGLLHGMSKVVNTRSLILVTPLALLTINERKHLRKFFHLIYATENQKDRRRALYEAFRNITIIIP